MHILIKNKSLHFGNYKVKCAIGKRGIGVKKREGDQTGTKRAMLTKKSMC